MDIWGLGCVFFEMLSLFPLFPGDNEIDQVAKIHKIMGSPPKELFNNLLSLSSRTDIVYDKTIGSGISKYLTHVSPECVDVINQMLIYDPEKRITAKQALMHPYFKDLVAEDNKKLISLNESLSFIKLNDSSIIGSTSKKRKNLKYNASKHNILLPNIKVYNYQINEDSEKENSKDYGHRNMASNNIHNYYSNKGIAKLPRINFHYGKAKGNYFASNDFKLSLKHNMSNQSIAELNDIKTIYSKSIIKKPVAARRNYISPYSKKNIENIVKIM